LLSFGSCYHFWCGRKWSNKAAFAAFIKRHFKSKPIHSFFTLLTNKCCANKKRSFFSCSFAPLKTFRLLWLGLVPTVTKEQVFSVFFEFIVGLFFASNFRRQNIKSFFSLLLIYFEGAPTRVNIRCPCGKKEIPNCDILILLLLLLLLLLLWRKADMSDL